MAATLLEDRIGLAVTTVTYRGQNESVVNLIGKTPDIGIDNVPASLTMILSRQGEALAITGKARSKHFPAVPTMEEFCIRSYNISSSLGLYAIEATPPNIVKRLGADLAEALTSDNYRLKIESAALEMNVPGPQEFAQVNRPEVQRWTRFADQIGAVINYAFK